MNKPPLWVTYSRKTRDDNFKNPMHFCLLSEKENAHAFLQKLHELPGFPLQLL